MMQVFTTKKMMRISGKSRFRTAIGVASVFVSLSFLAVSVSGETVETFPRFEATDIDGKTITGRLIALSAEEAVLQMETQTETETITLKRDRLFRLRNREPFDPQSITGSGIPESSRQSPAAQSSKPSQPGRSSMEKVNKLRGDRFPDASEPYRRPDQLLPPIVLLVSLVDGGSLVAETLTVDMKTAVMERGGNLGTLTFPISELSVVRFGIKSADLLEWDALRGGTPPVNRETALPEEWTRLLRTPARADRLVVRKGEELDTFTGIVREVNEKTVQFESDGEILPVPREKIAGIIYYQPESVPRAKEIALLRERSGSRIAVADLRQENAATLHWSGTSGGAAATPFNMLAELEFPQYNLLPLTRLAPTSVEQRFAYGWSDSGENPRNPGATEPLRLFERLIRPTVAESETPDATQSRTTADNRGNDGRPECSEAVQPDAVLDGVLCPDAMRIAAKTVLTYDLTEPFTRLRGTVGIDDRLRPDGKGRLTIRGDANVLFDRVLRGDEPATAMDISLDGIKRLTLTVDFPDGVDSGCQVTLGGVKLTREMKKP